MVLIQDLYNGLAPHEHTNQNEYFQNYEIHIGDNKDYSKNTKCAGGPFMKTDDNSNFQTVSYTHNGQTYSNQKVWKYGREHWCNLQGRYMTIVADLSHLTGAYEMSLCNVAIMGTKYELSAPNASSLSVKSGLTATHRLNKIAVKSGFEISNTLAIRHRQKSDVALSWVDVPSNDDADTEITIRAAAAPAGGPHNLVIEHYDNNSNVKAALYTETIAISIP